MASTKPDAGSKNWLKERAAISAAHRRQKTDPAVARLIEKADSLHKERTQKHLREDQKYEGTNDETSNASAILEDDEEVDIDDIVNAPPPAEVIVKVAPKPPTDENAGHVRETTEDVVRNLAEALDQGLTTALELSFDLKPEDLKQDTEEEVDDEEEDDDGDNDNNQGEEGNDVDVNDNNQGEEGNDVDVIDSLKKSATEFARDDKNDKECDESATETVWDEKNKEVGEVDEPEKKNGQDGDDENNGDHQKGEDDENNGDHQKGEDDEKHKDYEKNDDEEAVNESSRGRVYETKD